MSSSFPCLLSSLLTFCFSSFILSSCFPHILINTSSSLPYIHTPPPSPQPPVFTSTPLLSSSALIPLAPTSSLLHVLLPFLGKLVVLVNNWFWLSQHADKDNSRAIKSSSTVLSSRFLPPQPPLHTNTHCLLSLMFLLRLSSLPSSSQPSLRLSFCSINFFNSPFFLYLSHPSLIYPSLAFLILITSFVVPTHLNLI